MGLLKHNIGKSIKMARIHMGFTQEQLAKKMGTSNDYISLMENDHKNPSMAMLKKFSEKLEMPLAFIFILGLDEKCFRKKKSVRFNVAKITLQSIVRSIYS